MIESGGLGSGATLQTSTTFNESEFDIVYRSTDLTKLDQLDIGFELERTHICLYI